MKQVFISYSHKDKEYAHKLADEMARHGLEAWIDDRIDYGEQWTRVIQENLENSYAVIVIMTPTAYKSTWVQNELTFAQYTEKAIFPILLEGKLWLSLSSTQYVDVRGGKLPPESFFNILRKYLIKHDGERSLSTQIAFLLRNAVQSKENREWFIGLYKVRYSIGWHFNSYDDSLGTRPFSGGHFLKYDDPENYSEDYSFSCEVYNEDLLRLYDPEIYSDFRASILTIRKGEVASRLLHRSMPGWTRGILGGRAVDSWKLSMEKWDAYKLMERLHLYLGKIFYELPNDIEIQEFVKQLIQIHKDHHIPISEIQIRNAEAG
jgi:hypothetical protein